MSEFIYKVVTNRIIQGPLKQMDGIVNILRKGKYLPIF